MGRQPVNDAGQGGGALCRVIGIAKVLRPATHLSIHAQDQIELRDLRVAAPALDLLLELALLLWWDAQSQPARPIRVALTTQVIPQKPKALIPVRDARLQRMLRESQVPLQPIGHGG